jgi:hypothetical protein
MKALMVVVALVVVFVKTPAVEAVIEVEGGQWSPLCENIDRRLPCSVPDISTTVSTGSSFGHFIGEHTAEAIKSFYASPDGCPVFEELYSVSGSFRRFIDEYMAVHEEAYPTEHEEVVGMAEGAGIAASSVFIQNSCSEMYLLFGEDVKVVAEPTPVNPPPIYAPYLFSHTSAGTDDATIVDNVTDISSPSRHSRRKDHCSDIGLIYNSKDEDNDCDAADYHIVQGHNEDWWSGVADKMSVVHTPEWMGYAYPGQLPGTSFFTTAKGLAISMNSMYPLQPGYSHKSTSNGKGISYVFAYPLRKAISSNTISEVISTLSQHPVYSGYSLNVMSACDKSLTNVEGYGDRLGVQSRHSSSSSGGSNMCSSDSSGVVGHFNSYINLAVDESQSKFRLVFCTPAFVLTICGIFCICRWDVWLSTRVSAKY